MNLSERLIVAVGAKALMNKLEILNQRIWLSRKRAEKKIAAVNKPDAEEKKESRIVRVNGASFVWR